METWVVPTPIHKKKSLQFSWYVIFQLGSRQAFKIMIANFALLDTLHYFAVLEKPTPLLYFSSGFYVLQYFWCCQLEMYSIILKSHIHLNIYGLFVNMEQAHSAQSTWDQWHTLTALLYIRRAQSLFMHKG